MRGLSHAWGLARSLAMYYGQVWRNAGRRRFYGQFVTPGALCFDVGAHVGDRIRTFRQLGARVVAIEPQPRMIAVLRRLYGHDADVTLLPLGVGRAPGRLPLHISAATPTVSSFSGAWMQETQRDERFQSIHWDETVDVDITTLDALIAAHGVPAFAKIDVEGLELDVLEGLSRPVPALSFEYIPVAKARAQACVERLATLGPYEFRHSAVETMRWVEPSWSSADAMLSTLAALPLRAGSGDVYARLRAS